MQDGAVLHVRPEFPCVVGDNVTIGHRAVVHACTVINAVRIGIGAVLLAGALIEEGAQVGAGALVPPDIRRNALDYVNLWRRDYGPR